MAWDVPTLCSCFPRDGFNGFQGKTPVWARAQGEQALQEIHQIPPCPSPHLPFPWLGPLTGALTPHTFLLVWQVSS